MSDMDVFKLPVFPPADVFPMMADDELRELAEDIKENGLRDPLVIADIDEQSMLVDGRNRRKACKIVGVDPTTRQLNGEDPTAFVLSANIHRRNLSTGQRAMAVALIRPAPSKGGRGKKGTKSGIDFSLQRLTDARAVVAYSQELAHAVIRGEKPLSVALAEVDKSHGNVINARAQLSKLRNERPDLAELVMTEVMSLEGAQAKAKADAEEFKQQCWAATMEIIDGIRAFDRDPERAAETFDLYDAVLAESRGEAVTPQKIKRASAYLTALADAMEPTK